MEPIDLALLLSQVQAISQTSQIPQQFIANGVLTLNNDQILVLSTGSYLLSGMDISGQAVLKTDGPVNLLIQGAISINGQAQVNAQGKSGNLFIASDSGQPSIINAGASTVMILYAPRSELTLAGSAKVGGYLWAKSVKAAGTSLTIQAGDNVPAVTQVVSSSATEPGGYANDPGNNGKRKSAGLNDLTLGPDPSFAERDIYAFPNPARAGSDPIIHVEVGVAEQVDINVYDMAGDLVSQRTLSGAPGVVARGGQGAQYAYEQTIDGHLPTGVYLYTIHAKFNGQSIKKVGRFAVVR